MHNIACVKLYYVYAVVMLRYAPLTHVAHATTPHVLMLHPFWLMVTGNSVMHMHDIDVHMHIMHRHLPCVKFILYLCCTYVTLCAINLHNTSQYIPLAYVASFLAYGNQKWRYAYAFGGQGNSAQLAFRHKAQMAE